MSSDKSSDLFLWFQNQSDHSRHHFHHHHDDDDRHRHLSLLFFCPASVTLHALALRLSWILNVRIQLNNHKEEKIQIINIYRRAGGENKKIRQCGFLSKGSGHFLQQLLWTQVINQRNIYWVRTEIQQESDFKILFNVLLLAWAPEARCCDINGVGEDFGAAAYIFFSSTEKMPRLCYSAQI